MFFRLNFLSWWAQFLCCSTFCSGIRWQWHAKVNFFMQSDGKQSYELEWIVEWINYIFSPEWIKRKWFHTRNKWLRRRISFLNWVKCFVLYFNFDGHVLSTTAPKQSFCSLFYVLISFSVLHSLHSSQPWGTENIYSYLYRFDAFETANRRNNFRCGPFDSCDVSHRTWSRYARLTDGTPLICSYESPYSIIAIMPLKNVGLSHAPSDITSRWGNSIDMWKGNCWQVDMCCSKTFNVYF